MKISIWLMLVTLFPSLVFAEQIETSIVSDVIVKSTRSWDGSQLPKLEQLKDHLKQKKVQRSMK